MLKPLILYRDPIVCLAPRSFTPPQPDYVTIDDLGGKKFVYQREGFDADTNVFLGKHGIHVDRVFSVENDNSIVALVESGFGLCLIPELVIKKINHNALVFSIRPEGYRDICPATVKNRQLSIAAQTMHQHIVKFCKETVLQ